MEFTHVATNGCLNEWTALGYLGSNKTSQWNPHLHTNNKLWEWIQMEQDQKNNSKGKKSELREWTEQAGIRNYEAI